MSTNHARDSWADARTDEALRRELDALAGVGATQSRLDDALGGVRARVRRRRAAKQAGLGVTTLAAAGALVVGGASLLPDAPPPQPGPAESPSPTSSPSHTGTPEPSETATTAAAADCSAAGLDADRPDLSALPAPVRATATGLLDAALACDADALAERGRADGTTTSFGDVGPQEFWRLPGAEEDEDVYAILAGLVSDTRWAATPADDQGPFTYVWPRVATETWADDDGAWREAVDAGAVPAGLAAEMRGAGGYLGWRLGIHEDGTWQFFVAGD